jgi:hypothetical protein
MKFAHAVCLSVHLFTSKIGFAFNRAFVYHYALDYQLDQEFVDRHYHVHVHVHMCACVICVFRVYSSLYNRVQSSVFRVYSSLQQQAAYNSKPTKLAL